MGTYRSVMSAFGIKPEVRFESVVAALFCLVGELPLRQLQTLRWSVIRRNSQEAGIPTYDKSQCSCEHLPNALSQMERPKKGLEYPVGAGDSKSERPTRWIAFAACLAYDE
jgi:hypothetical protein